VRFVCCEATQVLTQNSTVGEWMTEGGLIGAAVGLQTSSRMNSTEFEFSVERLRLAGQLSSGVATIASFRMFVPVLVSTSVWTHESAGTLATSTAVLPELRPTSSPVSEPSMTLALPTVLAAMELARAAVVAFVALVALVALVAFVALVALVALAAVAALAALAAFVAFVAEGTVPSDDSRTSAPLIELFKTFAPVTAFARIFGFVTAFLFSCAAPTLFRGRLTAA
jgi:hypothetical protein